ncbi:Hypothetical protein CINCED_3A021921 [Cinara cedri]|uniref:Uncharacterized protein n=1 Tax=Cinara cedri TaxID=506608 RepID=A0A5E4N289_9HEMI|nr:Hypothetical protein CINCED_3A021921 [Cinara cedri]
MECIHLSKKFQATRWKTSSEQLDISYKNDTSSCAKFVVYWILQARRSHPQNSLCHDTNVMKTVNRSSNIHDLMRVFIHRKDDELRFADAVVAGNVSSIFEKILIRGKQS